MEGSPRSLRRWTWVLIAIASTGWIPTAAGAEEAEWIWAEGTTAESPVPVGQTCLFRKQINLRVPAEGRIEIAADDEYELFVNGKPLGTGQSAREIREYDISDQLEVGRNVVAVQVNNTHGETAALVARVRVRPEGEGKWFLFNSDASWKTSLEEAPMWQTVLYNDRLWGEAASFGALGDTVPWDRGSDVVAEQQTEQQERFQIQSGFGVERVLTDDQAGSVIAMAFNEFGHLILSQENGPLLLAYDQNDDGIPDQVRTYCDQVKSCQGILPLNGDVYVTGSGPDGMALYRLRDRDRNGSLEEVTPLVEFSGDRGEHGPHGLSLGPDGMIYVAVGSHVQATGKRGRGETYRDTYEGDLLPRYHDPGGHGRGVQAPGGTVIRTNTEGSVVEKVAGGVRNAYDIVFHPGGGMFVHDSDMEADLETTWYRPTMLFDVTEGGELGWRPGWAKWPEHYLDRLPSLLDTGRGSPTGGVCYEHYMFPARYHNTMFLADWSEGQILNVRLKSRGAGYDADSEVFLEGQPLNVTDLEVAKDGALYFCTGGRGTAGGVYRVVYQGEIPDRMKQLGNGIAAAVRQPQIASAWTRQEIASIKRELGSDWGPQIAGVAYSSDNPPHYRVRAMDLMQLFGPVPSEELILELSQAPSELVRARAATFLGLHPSERAARRLTKMLEDQDTHVQRVACEAILRSGQLPEDPAPVLGLISSRDRTLAFVARRVLERMPLDQWKNEVLETDDARSGIVGMLALVNADPTEATAVQVVQRSSELMQGFLSDADFVDMLRVAQVALNRGEIAPQRVETFRDQIAEEFPAGDPRMNQELIRLAAYLQADSVIERAIDYLDSDGPAKDRTLVAMCLQFFDHDWTAEQRFRLLKFYESAANRVSVGSLPMYIANVTRDFASNLEPEDADAILEQGAAWRNAALAALYKLPRPVDDTTAALLRQLDQELSADDEVDDIERRLRTGIIAMLATSDDERSTAHLRQIWRTEPERRAMVAMALAQQPEGENWDYLVRSLNVLDQQAAEEVIQALLTVRVATDDPMALRQLILLGLRAESDGRSSKNVQKLLEHWTETQQADGDSMQPWQQWYAKSYPDRLPAELPPPDESRWDLDELVKYIESDQGKHGDPAVGREVFTRVQCAECHRYQEMGDSVGPDLTSIARRFTRREILESILYPAHVVSDQYASKKLVTLDGRVLVGMTADAGNGRLQVRDANNEVTELDESEVDQILPSNNSIMPSGLLDDLTLGEIRDLMAFMEVIPAVEVATRPR